ncbi:MAG: hypothetical protein LBJ22_02575 [Synergistaceae bacterium]|jgi:hypothetical protein|nr:hypothetical protein [Synergistaceae bacterium]
MHKKTLKRRFAFFLVEILIALLTVSIVGVAVVQILWMVMNLFSQTEDYTVAHLEIERTFYLLGGQITNAGLGMPNNKMGVGSFASAFYSSEKVNMPIMGMMGEYGKDWGGPITLANSLSLEPAAFVKTKLPPEGKIYGGPVLYYAWSVPTGVHINGVTDTNTNKDLAPTSTFLGNTDVGEGMKVRFSLLRGKDDVTNLERFQSPYDGRPIGLSMDKTDEGSLASTRRWITFSTLRVPFWVSGWDSDGADWGYGSADDDTLTAVMAPEAGVLSPDMFLRVFANYEEVHLVQACRLYLERDKLIQEFFDTGVGESNRVKVEVAQGIVGLYFTFDPEGRLLTMYVAARGSDPMPVGKKDGSPKIWPNYPGAAIAAKDLKYRISAAVMTWRIRN